MNLAIIDDHLAFAELLKIPLENIHFIDSVQCFDSIDSYLDSSQEFGLIILDLNMPDKNGLALWEKEHQSDVIIFSECQDELIISKAFELGAKAFLPKTTSFTKILELIVMVKNGYKQSYGKKNLRKVNTLDSITSTEKQVLRLIAIELTNQEIANNLFISIGTVKRHIHNIKQKLNLDDKSELSSYYYNNYFELG